MWRRWLAKTLSSSHLILNRLSGTTSILWCGTWGDKSHWEQPGTLTTPTQSSSSWYGYWLPPKPSILFLLIQLFISEGDRQHRQRENICVERGVTQNARERRAPQGVGSCICQQARCRRLHDCHWDLTTAQPAGMFCFLHLALQNIIWHSPCFSEPSSSINCAFQNLI